MKIAIIDKIGLCYDGNTLSKNGLGGSESAVVCISKELQEIGFDVTVFNNCIDSDYSNEGVFDGVRYIDNKNAQTVNDIFDVVIVSRTVKPFIENTHPFILKAKKKILWLHDTFIDGDQIMEDLVVNGVIDHVFTLSDWHTSYILNSNHGKRRNFEVLKKHIFQTRNGANCYIPEVDISKKDKFHFVYNSSATKGMIPLVDNVWPEIKKRIPQAHLTIIGGYYRFKEGAKPDEQQNTVYQLSQREDLKKLDVNFTGLISQKEIANILSNAYMMLYPGSFPETFGISTLESLLYKTPLVTTRFGALEETAVDKACYLVDYAIEPNSLFTDINKDEQVKKFVDCFLQAYDTPYLHQQKQNYCDVVKDVAGWDTVALQWKQFFYDILGDFLPVDEYRKVTRINQKVQRVFGRENNPIAKKDYRSFGPQKRIFVVSPFWNAQDYLEKNIRSVASQDYDNYIHVLIDDNSDDNSEEKFNETLEKFPDYIKTKYVLVKNNANMGCIFNQLKAIETFGEDGDIIMLLDGDDWLSNNNTIFHYYNDLYSQGYEFTYGSMWSVVDNIPLIAQDYPLDVKKERSYRTHHFNWKIPYTHLRTFSIELLYGLEHDKFKVNNEWMKSGADNPLFYELIEKVEPQKIFCNKEIVCNYNDASPYNDYKIKSEEQNRNSNMSYVDIKNEKFTVVVPTMWKINSVFLPHLERLCDSYWVDEIILIDNNSSERPDNVILKHPKIKSFDFGRNIYVNPAWNFGVNTSKNNKVCILNDDLDFDHTLFEKIYDYIVPENGVSGLCPGIEEFNQPPFVDGSIDIKKWEREHTYGFGCMMFVNKQNWTDIPDGLDIYFGDNFIFDNYLRQGKSNFIISNIKHTENFAQTTSDENLTGGFLERERVIYQNIMKPKENKKKKILIAIPTNKYIEPETMKSIFDLEIPEGYETEFQYFYGYQIDQIRNLIARWAVNYDYLLSIDSDIVLPKDSLKKMISADKDVISGLYIQRIPDTHTLEVYMNNNKGGVDNIPYHMIKDKGVVEIMACGMGCALIKSEVFKKMEYPHFLYKSALDHKDTISEDIYFCAKARSLGYQIWADSSIICDHKGSVYFKV